MGTFTFQYFKDHGKGKLARVETSETRIPLNIFAEKGSDFDLAAGEVCEIQVCGVGSGFSFFDSEEAFKAKNGNFATMSMIPIGTFPSDENDANGEESCHILFSGMVLHSQFDPDAPEPNARLFVQTLDMMIIVGTNLDKPVEPLSIVSGVAWIYGDVKRKA